MTRVLCSKVKNIYCEEKPKKCNIYIFRAYLHLWPKGNKNEKCRLREKHYIYLQTTINYNFLSLPITKLYIGPESTPSLWSDLSILWSRSVLQGMAPMTSFTYDIKKIEKVTLLL